MKRIKYFKTVNSINNNEKFKNSISNINNLKTISSYIKNTNVFDYCKYYYCYHGIVQCEKFIDLKQILNMEDEIRKLFLISFTILYPQFKYLK